MCQKRFKSKLPVDSRVIFLMIINNMNTKRKEDVLLNYDYHFKFLIFTNCN